VGEDGARHRGDERERAVRRERRHEQGNRGSDFDRRGHVAEPLADPDCSRSGGRKPRELASARARATANYRNAEGVALGKPGRRLEPTRLAEAAARFPYALVGEEVVRVCDLKGHHLDRRIGLHPLDQVLDFVVHAIIDGIDGRMIEHDAPTPGASTSLLTVPERIRYRYHLDGFDREWSAPSTERTATYTNLAPAHYIFHVIASDGSGPWSGRQSLRRSEPHVAAARFRSRLIELCLLTNRTCARPFSIRPPPWP